MAHWTGVRRDAVNGSWTRGRIARVGIALALVGLLLPNLISQRPNVASAASYDVDEFTVSDRSTAEVRPRISGDVVVWQDYRGNPGDTIGEEANADIFMQRLDSDSDD